MILFLVHITSCQITFFFKTGLKATTLIVLLYFKDMYELLLYIGARGVSGNYLTY